MNDNAWLLFHPPNVRLPNETEEVPTHEPDTIDEVKAPSVPGMRATVPQIFDKTLTWNT